MSFPSASTITDQRTANYCELVVAGIRKIDSFALQVHVPNEKGVGVRLERGRENHGLPRAQTEVFDLGGLNDENGDHGIELEETGLAHPFNISASNPAHMFGKRTQLLVVERVVSFTLNKICGKRSDISNTVWLEPNKATSLSHEHCGFAHSLSSSTHDEAFSDFWTAQALPRRKVTLGLPSSWPILKSSTPTSAGEQEIPYWVSKPRHLFLEEALDDATLVQDDALLVSGHRDLHIQACAE
ncbi:hypothetical protein ARMSODRAFT_1004230 [Armillaria solidipes]|uniref:Uncharacterized protein n=1 Tax=Armillaria solidipes TaxID=1076256 RepID=A0A2H3BRA3_9AGAR|nr:hypothetical protein ARMSODRAFT_1004230 [Armillaria solidipes]